MNVRIITRILLLIGLLLFQVLIGNHIHLLGYATPLVVVYLLIVTPNDEPRWRMLLESFIIGLGMDITTNTPGMAAASMTLAALFTPTLLRITADPDRPDDVFVPSVKEMGWTGFMLYASLVTLSFTVPYYVIAWFTFSEMSSLLLSTIGSTVLTLLLVFFAERIHSKL